jgi:undecaprenyl-diphosphatase
MKLTNNDQKSKLNQILTLEFVIALALITVFSLVFIKLTREVMESETLGLDIQISNYIYGFRSAGLNNLMNIISYFGEQLVILFVVCISVFLFIKKRFREIVVIISTVSLGSLSASLIKILVDRPRPNLAPLQIETNASFPSIHTTNAFIFYFLVIYLFSSRIKNQIIRYSVSLMLFLLAYLVAFSRIYLGVHYPSDVLGGICVAGICLCFAWVLNYTLKQKSNLS